MPYPPPRIHTQTFEEGINTDLADELVSSKMARYMLNCRVVSSAGGNLGIVTNIKGTVMITTPLPDGDCKTIGAQADEKNNKFYFAVWNSNGYHTWFLYDEILNRIIPFLQSINDSDDIDILRFDKNYPILHIDLVIITNIETGQDNTAIYWCDGLNKARKTNIQKCLDKTDTGYSIRITEDYVTAYKKCPVYAPVPTYFTELARDANFLYAQLFKFCYRYIYDDGEISNYSDWSIVALPLNELGQPGQSYQGVTGITTDNNGINVAINSGSRIVRKMELAMLTTGVTTVNSVEVQGASLLWVTVAILDKNELLIADDTIYNYKFYNDGSYPAADQSKINRPYSSMFRVPICQAFLKSAMTYTGGDEGFPQVNVNVSVVNNPIPLFIPPGTENQTNHPSIDITQLSYSTKTSGIWVVVRYDPIIQFTIGHDVKAGNIFTISGRNGNKTSLLDPHWNHTSKGGAIYDFSYKATLADTAVSVANQIKAYLRSIGRGLPDGNNGISGESVDGPGNATFIYSFNGLWEQNIVKFTGTVQAVQYEVLKNNGVSVQVIKSGSARQYGIGYEDDDGRKSNVYTNDACIIRTPFLTESPGGTLQQPVHELSVFHRPPVWARRWVLYRTPDEVNFIQILIQKVIDVTVISGADPGEYLDLVVGSLSTYQKIHPDVILSYQFTRGDRLRLIRDTTSGDYYTPFYETEILDYSEVKTEQRNAQITTYGSQYVTPADGVISDYVGKSIIIDGIERVIIAIGGSGHTGDYILDSIINIGAVLATVLVPSYVYIDRRGIVRIPKPPVGYTIVDFSTVELYTPVKNTNNLDFQLFNDTAQKFEVLNYGTDTRAHAGSHQNQDGTDAGTLISTPAIILVTEGDVYIRDRELPVNNELLNTEIRVDSVEDPNFSDFYISNLNNLGRTFPKDNGTGQKHFDSRTRFSNNYITDTAINGLNDFDNLDRVDNNDAFGAVMLTKFKGNKLYLFKRLRDGYLPVGRTIITTATGVEVIGLSNKLLGDIVYLEFEGGIGNNPESWFINDNYMYHAMPDAGAFVRIAGDGIDAISKEFGFDYGARKILASVKKYNLRMPGGFDKPNGNSWWSVPEYIPPVYNNPITQADWIVIDTSVPDGSTPIIVTNPANGVVTYDSEAKNFVVVPTTGFAGNDTFSYKFQYPDTTYSSIVNVCITVVERLNSSVSYQPRDASKYCILTNQDGSYENDGNESVTTLEGFYLEDGTLTGFIMPNVQFITAACIVPDGATITFNQDASPAPSGGADNDIIYNVLVNDLYVKIAGVWTLQTGRLLNTFFQSPIPNLTDCPLPAPPAGHFTIYAQHGMEIVSVVDGTTTGVPAAFATANLMPPASMSAVYTVITAGNIDVVLDGSPDPFGHVDIILQIGGVLIDSKPVTGPGPYTLACPLTNDPTLILISFNIVA